MYNFNNAVVNPGTEYWNFCSSLKLFHSLIIMAFHFRKSYFLSECATPSSYRVSNIISVLRQLVTKFLVSYALADLGVDQEAHGHPFSFETLYYFCRILSQKNKRYLE